MRSNSATMLFVKQAGSYEHICTGCIRGTVHVPRPEIWIDSQLKYLAKELAQICSCGGIEDSANCSRKRIGGVSGTNTLEIENAIVDVEGSCDAVGWIHIAGTDVCVC